VLGPYVQQADLENGVVGAKKGYAAVQESWEESFTYMSKEPASDDEEERGGIRDRLQQQPQSNSQVQSSQQKKGKGSGSSTDEKEVQ
jgi:hypothetical protein